MLHVRATPEKPTVPFSSAPSSCRATFEARPQSTPINHNSPSRANHTSTKLLWETSCQPLGTRRDQDRTGVIFRRPQAYLKPTTSEKVPYTYVQVCPKQNVGSPERAEIPHHRYAWHEYNPPPPPTTPSSPLIRQRRSSSCLFDMAKPGAKATAREGDRGTVCARIPRWW